MHPQESTDDSQYRPADQGQVAQACAHSDGGVEEGKHVSTGPAAVFAKGGECCAGAGTSSHTATTAATGTATTTGTGINIGTGTGASNTIFCGRILDTEVLPQVLEGDCHED